MIWCFRIAGEIEKLIKELNRSYDQLNQTQADYLSMDTSKTEWGLQGNQKNLMPWVSRLTFHNLHGRSLDKAKNVLMTRFAECTKHDVTLNNYLQRSKTLVFLIFDHFSFPTSPPLILQSQIHRAKPRNIKKPTESVRTSQGVKPPAKRKTKESEHDDHETGGEPAKKARTKSKATKAKDAKAK